MEKAKKFLQRKVIEHEGFSFEFNLLNTAPMSLLDADDRGYIIYQMMSWISCKSPQQQIS